MGNNSIKVCRFLEPLLSYQLSVTGIFNGLVEISSSDSYKFPAAAVRRSYIACVAIRLVIIWVMKHVPPPGVCPLYDLSLSVSSPNFFFLSLVKAGDGWTVTIRGSSNPSVPRPIMHSWMLGKRRCEPRKSDTMAGCLTG